MSAVHGSVHEPGLLQAALERNPVDEEDQEGRTAMCVACEHGDLTAVQLLSSYGARRRHIGSGMFAEEAAANEEVLEWLIASRFWTTALHHVDIISSKRARSLLRNGAKLHARLKYFGERAPTPLDLAMQSDSEASALIREAAEPWSTRTHHLWPAAARTQAEALVGIGHQLCRHLMPSQPCGAFLDPWLSHVLPMALDRDEKWHARPRFRRRVSKESRGA